MKNIQKITLASLLVGVLVFSLTFALNVEAQKSTECEAPCGPPISERHIEWRHFYGGYDKSSTWPVQTKYLRVQNAEGSCVSTTADGEVKRIGHDGEGFYVDVEHKNYWTRYAGLVGTKNIEEGMFIQKGIGIGWISEDFYYYIYEDTYPNASNPLQTRAFIEYEVSGKSWNILPKFDAISKTCRDEVRNFNCNTLEAECNFPEDYEDDWWDIWGDSPSQDSCHWVEPPTSCPEGYVEKKWSYCGDESHPQHWACCCKEENQEKEKREPSSSPEPAEPSEPSKIELSISSEIAYELDRIAAILQQGPKTEDLPAVSSSIQDLYDRIHKLL